MNEGPEGPPEEHGPALNTDRELWRERPDDFYAPSVFLTESGGIGMNVGGTVFVKPIRAWFALAGAAEPPRDFVARHQLKVVCQRCQRVTHAAWLPS